jgi:hypothetical protein
MKVTQIPNSSYSTVFMYYGNTTPVSSASNIDNTLIAGELCEGTDGNNVTGWSTAYAGDGSMTYSTDYVANGTTSCRVTGAEPDSSMGTNVFRGWKNITLPSYIDLTGTTRVVAELYGMGFDNWDNRVNFDFSNYTAGYSDATNGYPQGMEIYHWSSGARAMRGVETSNGVTYHFTVANWVNATWERYYMELNSTFIKWSFKGSVTTSSYTDFPQALNQNFVIQAVDVAGLDIAGLTRYFDNLEVYQATTPEPTYIIGAEETQAPYLSITYNYSSVSFGALSSPSTDNPAPNQLDGVYNVTISTNADYKVSANGTVFSDGTHTFPVSNLKVDTNSTAGDLAVGSAVALSGAQDIDSYSSSVTANYHGFWLSIPSSQYAGSYSSTVAVTYSNV